MIENVHYGSSQDLKVELATYLERKEYTEFSCIDIEH